MKTFIAALICASALVAQSTTVGPAVFTGSGLNDASSGGAFTALPTNALFTATITANGTPDHFAWTEYGSAPVTGVAITGGTCITGGTGWQTLAQGVQICWLASTGHHIGDAWATSVSATSSSAGVNFIATGPKAIARTTQDKLRNDLVVNVADYAASFGVLIGASDTASVGLNSAQNALPVLYTLTGGQAIYTGEIDLQNTGGGATAYPIGKTFFMSPQTVLQGLGDLSQIGLAAGTFTGTAMISILNGNGTGSCNTNFNTGIDRVSVNAFTNNPSSLPINGFDLCASTGSHFSNLSYEGYGIAFLMGGSDAAGAIDNSSGDNLTAGLLVDPSDNAFHAQGVVLHAGTGTNAGFYRNIKVVGAGNPVNAGAFNPAVQIGSSSIGIKLEGVDIENLPMGFAIGGFTTADEVTNAVVVGDCANACVPNNHPFAGEVSPEGSAWHAQAQTIGYYKSGLVKSDLWQPGGFYPSGSKVVDYYGNLELSSGITTAGMAQPVWSATLGGTVSDGGGHWTNIWLPPPCSITVATDCAPVPGSLILPWQASHLYSIGETYLDGNFYVELITSSGTCTSAASAPTWPATGGTGGDGGCTVTNQGTDTTSYSYDCNPAFCLWGVTGEIPNILFYGLVQIPALQVGNLNLSTYNIATNRPDSIPAGSKFFVVGFGNGASSDPSYSWVTCTDSTCSSSTNFAQWGLGNGGVCSGYGLCFDSAGTVNAAFGGAVLVNGSLEINGGISGGVTCSGAPTGSFAVTKGVVTHC